MSDDDILKDKAAQISLNCPFFPFIINKWGKGLKDGFYSKDD